jgi:hypothetical protein
MASNRGRLIEDREDTRLRVGVFQAAVAGGAMSIVSGGIADASSIASLQSGPLCLVGHTHKGPRFSHFKTGKYYDCMK